MDQTFAETVAGEGLTVPHRSVCNLPRRKVNDVSLSLQRWVSRKGEGEMNQHEQRVENQRYHISNLF